MWGRNSLKVRKDWRDKDRLNTGSSFDISGVFVTGFFRIRSGCLANPDPDSEKKSDPDPWKKTWSETLGFSDFLHIQTRIRMYR